MSDDLGREFERAHKENLEASKLQASDMIAELREAQLLSKELKEREFQVARELDEAREQRNAQAERRTAWDAYAAHVAGALARATNLTARYPLDVPALRADIAKAAAEVADELITKRDARFSREKKEADRADR